MAEAAVVEIEALAVALPATVEKPIAAMNLGELAVAANREALIACLDMCKRYDPDMDIKERRLIADLAGMLTRANLRAAEGEFARQKHNDDLALVLEGLKTRKAAKKTVDG